MNIRQFTGFCYDEIAKDLNYTRISNFYFKVGEGYFTGFGISRQGYFNQLKVMVDIIPLAGEFDIFQSYCNMTDVAYLFFQDDIRCSYAPPHIGLHFSASFTQEQYQAMKDTVLEIYETIQKPLLTYAKDLYSAFSAKMALDSYRFARAPLAVRHGFNMDANYWMFLLETKHYQTAIENFEGYERWYQKEYGHTNERNPNGIEERLRFFYQNKQYDEIEKMLDKYRKKNVDLLNQLSKGKIVFPDSIREKYLR